MRKVYALSALALLLPTILLLYLNFSDEGVFTSDSERKETSLPLLYVGGTPVRVEIAESEEALTRGLSGRESLPEGTGLLFVFPTDDYWGIWMKDMRFAIDVLWIDKNARIIDIEKTLQPATFPKTFFPADKARYVLEVPAHFAEIHSIIPGDKVTLPGSLR